MAFIHYLQPQVATITAATAGGTYAESVFHFGRSVGQVEFTNGSTADVFFMLQGCNSSDGSWFDMKGAASTVSSGASVRVTSTYNLIFDRLRIETTAASATTASTSFTFVLSAR
jgi:hypothetical protein